MKRLLIIALVLSASFGFAEALTNNVLTYFSGRQDGDAIVLEWKSGVEDGIKSYSVERTSSTEENYKEVGTVRSLGNFATYRFKDTRPSVALQENSEPPEPMADVYRYRLKLQYDKEISYSQAISVTKPSAGVKRTWGMIKEMFH